MSDLATRLYLSSLGHLSGALGFEWSLYDEDDFQPPDGVGRLGHYGAPHYGQLQEWTVHEFGDVWSKAMFGLDPETMADNFTGEELPTLWADARRINARFPGSLKESYLLTIYYQAVVRVLELFDIVMREPLIESSPLQERYFKKLETFNLLKAALLDAHPIPKEYETNAELRNLIDECTERFAATWERMVREAAHPDVSA